MRICLREQCVQLAAPAHATAMSTEERRSWLTWAGVILFTGYFGGDHDWRRDSATATAATATRLRDASVIATAASTSVRGPLRPTDRPSPLAAQPPARTPDNQVNATPPSDDDDNRRRRRLDARRPTKAPGMRSGGSRPTPKLSEHRPIQGTRPACARGQLALEASLRSRPACARDQLALRASLRSRPACARGPFARGPCRTLERAPCSMLRALRVDICQHPGRPDVARGGIARCVAHVSRRGRPSQSARA
jgi:hypothetical protein